MRMGSLAAASLRAPSVVVLSLLQITPSIMGVAVETLWYTQEPADSPLAVYACLGDTGIVPHIDQKELALALQAVSGVSPGWTLAIIPLDGSVTTRKCWIKIRVSTFGMRRTLATSS